MHFSPESTGRLQLIARWSSVILVLGLAATTAFSQRLSQNDIKERLQKRIPSFVIEKQVKDRGITFVMNKKVEDELRNEGASDQLIILLKQIPVQGVSQSSQSSGGAPESQGTSNPGTGQHISRPMHGSKLQGSESTSTNTATLLGWAVGTEGLILHTEDGGHTWQQQTSGVDHLLSCVTFEASQWGWAAGWSDILHTEDGGRSWHAQRVEPSSGGINSIFFITRKLGWVAINDGIILHTEDGGHTWQQQRSGTNAHLTSVTFVTEKSGWVVGGQSTVLHTEDGGHTWQKQNSNIGDLLELSSVLFTSAQAGWVVGEDGVILHTENAGGTWQEIRTGFFNDLTSIAFATPENGWVVGGHGTILHTGDGGRTWRRQRSGADMVLKSVVFLTPRLGWAAGGDYSQERVVLHTEDGGSHWSNQDVGSGASITAVAFANPE